MDRGVHTPPCGSRFRGRNDKEGLEECRLRSIAFYRLLHSHYDGCLFVHKLQNSVVLAGFLAWDDSARRRWRRCIAADCFSMVGQINSCSVSVAGTRPSRLPGVYGYLQVLR